MKRLNFGCGKDIRKGYVNVDVWKSDGVDLAFDFEVFPYPLPDNEFNEVYADNVVEHLLNIPAVMVELHRVVKPGGVIRIIVPHFHCYGAYNDVTHYHYFSPYAFEPFYRQDARGNSLIKERFRLKRIKLIPTRLGRLLLFDFIRKPLSFIFGQIYQTIDIELIVDK